MYLLINPTLTKYSNNIVITKIILIYELYFPEFFYYDSVKRR